MHITNFHVAVVPYLYQKCCEGTGISSHRRNWLLATRYAPCVLLAFLRLIYNFFITRHVVGVFGFKCPSAVFAGSYLTAAAISEPPPLFLLDHGSEFDEVRKCVCTHTCTHTDIKTRLLRLHTESYTRPRGYLIPFLHTSLPSLASPLPLLSFWCKNCLQCCLSLRKVYLWSCQVTREGRGKTTIGASTF